MLKSLENSPNYKRSKIYFETLENKLKDGKTKCDKNFYLAVIFIIILFFYRLFTFQLILSMNSQNLN